MTAGFYIDQGPVLFITFRTEYMRSKYKLCVN